MKKVGNTLEKWQANYHDDSNAMETKVYSMFTEDACTSNDSSSAIHPLLIDHILDNIFQYIVGYKCDVYTVRLVCRLWKERVTILYRRGKSMHFSDFGANPDKPNEKMKRFLDIMESSTLIPIESYRITMGIFVPQNIQLILDFVEICLPDAVELWLCIPDFSFLYLLPRRASNWNSLKLKKLIIQCTKFKNDPESSQEDIIPYFMEDLLKSAQKLREFRIDLQDFSTSQAEKLLIWIWSALPKSLKTLTLFTPNLSDQCLQSLAHNKLRLNECMFSFTYNYDDGSSRDGARNFFEGQSDTLTKLHIFDSALIIPYFPAMKELLELRIPSVKFTPFSIRNTFPKLTALHLEEIWSRTADDVCAQLLSAGKVLSVKRLSLPNFCEAELVRRSADCFTNLTCLHISESSATGEALQEVFTRLISIEVLSVKFRSAYNQEGSWNGDSVFSGVSKDECMLISKLGNLDYFNIQKLMQKPAIINLKKLKVLILDGSNSNILFTDFTAHFMLLNMTNLEEVDADCFKITREYKHRLESKLKKVVIRNPW